MRRWTSYQYMAIGEMGSSPEYQMSEESRKILMAPSYHCLKAGHHWPQPLSKGNIVYYFAAAFLAVGFFADGFFLVAFFAEPLATFFVGAAVSSA